MIHTTYLKHLAASSPRSDTPIVIINSQCKKFSCYYLENECLVQNDIHEILVILTPPKYFKQLLHEIFSLAQN